VYDNQLTSLPESLAQLTRLEEFHLRGNRFSQWPGVVGQMGNLWELDFERNQLTALPDSFGALSEHLEHLHLNFNQLETVPESVGTLKNLECLSLSGNPLTSLPDSLMKLEKLRFFSVPREVGPFLTPELKRWIEELPGEVRIG